VVSRACGQAFVFLLAGGAAHGALAGGSPVIVVSPSVASTVSPSRAWWRNDDVAVSEAVATAPSSGVAFAALVAFTAILLLSPQIWFPVLGTLRIALVSAGLAIGAHLLHRLAGQRATPFFPEVGIAVALVCWSVITIPVSYWPGGSVNVLTDHYLKAVAFFWLIGTLATTTSRLRVLAWTLVLCSIPLAATGLSNYVSGVFLATRVPGLKRIYGYHGGSGIAGNPNDLALILNLTIPIAAAMMLSAQRAAARLVAAAALVLGAMTVIVTFSRAGFLTLATTVVMLAFWLVRRRAPVKAAIVVLAGLCSLPYLPQGYADRLSTITDIAADQTGSALGRWKDYRIAVDVVAHDPIIGVGIGQDVLAMNERRGAKWTSVHNAFLQYAVDLGLPGLILFAWLYMSCVRSAREVERRAAKDPALRELSHIAGGVHVALIAFGVAALFHPIAYQFYFFSIGGMAVALKRAYVTASEPADPAESQAS
jgi:probable O-glycosylation ligase (exosortase A-associated)